MFWKKRDRTVRAQAFILEDANGQDRARLTVDEHNNAVLHFRDDQGQSRLYLGLTPEGTPRIGLGYAGGQGSIQLEANDRLNCATLIFVGPSGKAQVLLGIGRSGHPLVALYDEAGKQVFPIAPPAAGTHLNDDLDGFDWDELLRPPNEDD